MYLHMRHLVHSLLVSKLETWAKQAGKDTESLYSFFFLIAKIQEELSLPIVDQLRNQSRFLTHMLISCQKVLANEYKF